MLLIVNDHFKSENISNNEEVSLAVIVNISITNKLERERKRGWFVRGVYTITNSPKRKRKRERKGGEGG